MCIQYKPIIAYFLHILTMTAPPTSTEIPTAIPSMPVITPTIIGVRLSLAQSGLLHDSLLPFSVVPTVRKILFLLCCYYYFYLTYNQGLLDRCTLLCAHFSLTAATEMEYCVRGVSPVSNSSPPLHHL